MNTFQEHPQTLICTLDTRLDTLSSQQLEWELDSRIMDTHKEVVFDLGAVEFVSSSFLRLCLKMAKLRGPENFRVVNASPAILQVFNIANLTGLVREG